MPVNHDRPLLLRRVPLALGAAALLGIGGGTFAVTHAGASAPAAVVHSATLTQATSPAPSGAAAPAPNTAEAPETAAAPETGTAAEAPEAPEAPGTPDVGWADPAGSAGADQQGEN